MNRRHALSFVNPYSSAVLVLAVAALGLAAALGLSLILKLRSIRTRGFGEGTPLALPEAGLELRYPHWWKRARGAAAAAPAVVDGGAGAGPSAPSKRSEVVLGTGHSRGLLRISAWREPGPGDEAGLRSDVRSFLREQGLELDDPEITVVPLPGPADAARRSGGGGLNAWVASGGRRSSRPEERTYFEVHLVALEGARVFFSYTNSVLQGFLDAYYLEKVLDTLRPARPTR